MDWNDLRLFTLLARHGSLGAAARAAGVSAATLGRRVQALEAALDKRLVERGADGYRPTADGRALADAAEPMEEAALAIGRWRDLGAAGRAVRISAGAFTSRFLASHARELAGPGDGVRLQFLTAEHRLDIARRAADIGLRARRPEEAWLAGRRLGRVAFAIYGRPDAPRDFVSAIGAITPAGRWLRERHGGRIAVEASDPGLLLELARAGAGRALLPCFVGDGAPELVRLEGPIPELLHENWIVMHHDDRHDPAIRAVASRIARLVRANRAAFAGDADPGAG